MATPHEILALALAQATSHINEPFVADANLLQKIEYVCRNLQNRAGVRVLLACSLAKIHRPEVDIRRPYTEIGGKDSYSGRTYDEAFVTTFITKNNLPCNHTTAFLTPALRNRNITLTPEVNLVGRPAQLYEAVLQLLDAVYQTHISAEDLLAETVRWLLIVRNENQQRIDSLLISLKSSQGGIPLSAEAIVRMMEQHIEQPRASRLPVLVVAAAYQAASKYLGVEVRPLEAHNAADIQTQAVGDLEIIVANDDEVIVCYEMKTRRVLRDDIDLALHKIQQSKKTIDHYVFITTDVIEQDTQAYAASIYDQTGGVEVVILDCIGFLRHFLHLFHRLRMDFVETYQQLVLSEPDSAVSQPLKEVFLALRQAAEGQE